MNLIVLIIAWIPVAAGVALLMTRHRPRMVAIPLPVHAQEQADQNHEEP